MDTLKVRDAKDVEEVVRAAIASEQPLEIIGHGTKRAIGHPMATNAVLDVSDLNAVTAYEPNELIITVQAGAPRSRRRYRWSDISRSKPASPSIRSPC